MMPQEALYRDVPVSRSIDHQVYRLASRRGTSGSQAIIQILVPLRILLWRMTRGGVQAYSMPSAQRVYVEECEDLLGFEELKGWNIP